MTDLLKSRENLFINKNHAMTVVFEPTSESYHKIGKHIVVMDVIDEGDELAENFARGTATTGMITCIVRLPDNPEIEKELTFDTTHIYTILHP